MNRQKRDTEMMAHPERWPLKQLPLKHRTRHNNIGGFPDFGYLTKEGGPVVFLEKDNGGFERFESFEDLSREWMVD